MIVLLKVVGGSHEPEISTVASSASVIRETACDLLPGHITELDRPSETIQSCRGLAPCDSCKVRVDQMTLMACGEFECYESVCVDDSSAYLAAIAAGWERADGAASNNYEEFIASEIAGALSGPKRHWYCPRCFSMREGR